MNCRRIASLTCFWVAVVPDFALAGQDLRPILDRSERIGIPGVSVLPPQGEDWFLFPESGPDDSLIRFVQRVGLVPPVRAEDARQVLAGVAVQDSGNAAPRTPAQFLADFNGEYFKDGKMRVREMLTSRQRLVRLEAGLDDAMGATCVRYNRLTEIVGQFPQFPDLVALTSTRGLLCSHPSWPQYEIDVTYQQIYAKGQPALPRDAESDAFLGSVRFTADRPTAVVGPRELLSFHLQAGLRASDDERWADAERSFQAALKAAEYFGPQSVPLAVSLYYLGSTRARAGRPEDAEALFRRALGIFEGQSGGSAETAQFHGQTLQDLAVVLARRAAGGTAASRETQLQEAERLLREALSIRERSDPSQVGRTLTNLTQVYIDLGR